MNLQHLAEFGELILGATRKQLAPIQPMCRDGELPLSFAEQRLWFLDQLQEGSVVYNEQEGLRLSGLLSVEALEKVVQENVRRHESLRTNYQAIAGSPVRVIHPEMDLQIPIVDLLCHQKLNKLLYQQTNSSFSCGSQTFCHKSSEFKD